jgi:hypothetical protein
MRGDGLALAAWVAASNIIELSERNGVTLAYKGLSR